MTDWNYTCQVAHLKPHDSIFAYTDGLNEAEDITHAQFGEKRMIDIISSLMAEDQDQPETIVRRISEAVHTFVGEAEQSDDLTMLAIQYKGN